MISINPDLRLSEHFVLREFTDSATARRLHIDNMPGLCHVSRLIALCQHVLEPLRMRFGPVIINSGYRCVALNRAVGGVASSQHIQGEAADVRTATLQEAQRMYDYVRKHLVYDQVILERSRRTGSVWLHVSYRSDELRNRRQGLRLVTAENLGGTMLPELVPLPSATAEAPPPQTAVRKCCKCSVERPVTQFALLPSGNRRGMCNHCRWLCHVQPSRHRRILRQMVG